MTGVDWTLRGIVAVNLALAVLSLIPAFSGIDQGPGLADRLWGNVRFAGWRADIVWVCASTLIVFVGGFRWTTRRGPRQTTSILCWAWLPLFLGYVYYQLSHMFS
jgi:hypothetical protein